MYCNIVPILLRDIPLDSHINVQVTVEECFFFFFCNIELLLNSNNPAMALLQWLAHPVALQST